MKKTRKFLTIFLSMIMLASVTSCVTTNDVHSEQGSEEKESSVYENPEEVSSGGESSEVESSTLENSEEESSEVGEVVDKKVSKEEWISAFELLRVTNNVTINSSFLNKDKDLKPESSFKQCMKIADGNKIHLRHYDSFMYTNESVEKLNEAEQYFARIEGVDYFYQKDTSTGKWQREKAPIEMSYVVDTTNVGMWLNAYDEMTYDEERGVYRQVNKVVDDGKTIPYTMYYMEVEFRDGKLYRIEHEGDVIHYGVTAFGESYSWLEGRSITTKTYEDYGTTEIALPEIEE